MSDLSWTDRPDYVILAELLGRHAPARAPLAILDACANRGHMWEGSGYLPTVAVDLAATPDGWAALVRNPAPGRVVATCGRLPFPDGTFDVITFDPPHVPGPSDRHGTRPDWIAHYGMGQLPTGKANGVSALFAPFLMEARRVLRPGGIILAKLADGVYQDRYRWHHHEFLGRVDRLRGLTACDVKIKVRASAGTPWRPDRLQQFHGQAAHSYWIVVRKGTCQGRGIPRPARPTQAGLWREG